MASNFLCLGRCLLPYLTQFIVHCNGPYSLLPVEKEGRENTRYMLFELLFIRKIAKKSGFMYFFIE
jgi:hypothetical protein